MLPEWQKPDRGRATHSKFFRQTLRSRPRFFAAAQADRRPCRPCGAGAPGGAGGGGRCGGGPARRHAAPAGGAETAVHP